MPRNLDGNQLSAWHDFKYYGFSQQNINFCYFLLPPGPYRCNDSNDIEDPNGLLADLCAGCDGLSDQQDDVGAYNVVHSRPRRGARQAALRRQRLAKRRQLLAKQAAAMNAAVAARNDMIQVGRDCKLQFWPHLLYSNKIRGQFFSFQAYFGYMWLKFCRLC